MHTRPGKRATFITSVNNSEFDIYRLREERIGMVKDSGGGGRHDDKSQHDGYKDGGGSGKFGPPKDGGKHSGGTDKGGKK